MLQRSCRRREPARQVVPGPSASEAGRFEGAIVEDVVVADDPSGDAPHPQRPQLGRPAQKGVVGAACVDCRIADSAHHQIAVQRAVTDRGGAEQRGLEAVVPAEPFRGGGQGDELHRGRGRQQHVGVAGVEALVPVEHADIHAPDGGPDPARVEQPLETPGQAWDVATFHGPGRRRLADVGRGRTIPGREGRRYAPGGVPSGNGIDRAFRGGGRRRRLDRAIDGVGGSGGARKGNRCAGARQTPAERDGGQRCADTESPSTHSRHAS